MMDQNPGQSVAVALKWEGTRERAPEVVASGRAAIAEEILRRADAAGVPLYPDSELAPLLALVPPTHEVPPALFSAVAEVLAFTYWTLGKQPEDGDSEDA
ncbi:MAG: EscU/YscU/HrcU family type III secretion system export apparatus switch protein [Pseudomonadota bacterium]|nr:EscU/YscU/HrcU family type III secretion system export apparatus switch protein [Pseudomonadota bacterium]